MSLYADNVAAVELGADLDASVGTR